MSRKIYHCYKAFTCISCQLATKNEGYENFLYYQRPKMLSYNINKITLITTFYKIALCVKYGLSIIRIRVYWEKCQKIANGQKKQMPFCGAVQMIHKVCIKKMGLVFCTVAQKP